MLKQTWEERYEMDEDTKPTEVEEVVADQAQPLEVSEEPQVADESAPPVVETEEASPEAAQEESEEEAPEEKPLSQRAKDRFEKLEALRNAGRDRFQQLQQPAPSQPNALDYSTALDADPETVRQLEADRQRAQQESYAEGLKRAEYIEFKTNIRLDLPLVSDKLSKLDPRDAEGLDRDYLEYVGFDRDTQTVKHPDVGYADYVLARLEQSERLAQAMNAQTVKNVARQAAATGLRPDGSSAKRLNLNQPAENMSIEELYASIGQKPPKK